MRFCTRAFAGALLLALAWSTAAQAKDYLTPGTERFKFWGGVGLNIYDNSVRIGSSNTPLQGSINLEDDLNLDKTRPAAFLGGYWRFYPKHRFTASYTRLRQSGSNTLSTDIHFVDNDGNTVTANTGAETNTDLDIDLATLGYLYSFYHRKDFELSAGAGLYWADLSLKLSAQGNLVINNGTPSSVSIERSVDLSVAAPLPYIGFTASYFLKPNWSLGTYGNFFYLELEGGDLTGSLWNFGFNTEYYFTRNVGIGGALTVFGVKADTKDGDTKADLEYSYLGPQLYLVGKFK
jgi:hypothetical protein